MARINADRAEVSSDAVRAFFEARASGAAVEEHHAVTTFVDKESAEARHIAEAGDILPMLFDSKGAHRWLDIGCGGGRWGLSLVREHPDQVAAYCGVDFSQGLLRLAEALKLGPKASFYQMPADSLDESTLAHGGLFTRVLVIALSLYMNDDAVQRMLASIARLCAPGAIIYLREPVSLSGTRLTLVDEHSNKLDAAYNAVYRTAEDYEALLRETGSLDLIESDFMKSAHFQRYAETRHRYFLLRRRS